jgi:hypothetical protein
MSIYITNDNGSLTMKGSSKAIIKSSIKIVGTNSELPIEVVGDFKDIPQNLHQAYIQSMLASYGSVNVYNYTEPEPKTIKEQKSGWRLNRIVDIISKVISKK